MQLTITKLPLTGGYINKIDKDVKTLGFQGAMMNIVRHSGTRLNVLGINKKLDRVLKNERVLVISNHPNGFDPIMLIAAMPSRKDAYLVVNADFVGLSPELDKHLIPVYIRHRLGSNDYKTKYLLEYLQLKILKNLHPTPKLTPEQEHKKNIENIALAGKKIENGGLVILFPAGGSINNHWLSGVGHLLTGIKTEHDIYLVNSYIEGRSSFDFLRPISKLGKILPTVKVTFSPPKKVNNLIKQEPKFITAKLEHLYNNWVLSLSKVTPQKED